MLMATGFASDDLAAVAQPVLVINGGRKNSLFQQRADRLVSVIPTLRRQYSLTGAISARRTWTNHLTARRCSSASGLAHRPQARNAVQGDAGSSCH